MENPDRDPDRWRLRPGSDTRVLIHFDEGEGPIAADASGTGSHLLLDPLTIPPPDRWLDLADSTAYRDDIWGGWLPNGIGTTPDETDLDRDRSGYAIRAHGASLRGEIALTSPLRMFDPEGHRTFEWIGSIGRRTGDEQPLFVDEIEEGDGRRHGWRIVVAETGAEEAYRFRWYDSEGNSRSLPFGESVRNGEVEYMSLTVGVNSEDGAGGLFARARIGAGPAAIRRAEPRSDSTSGSIVVFADPFREESATYYHLREIRISESFLGPVDPSPDVIRLGLEHRPPAD